MGSAIPASWPSLWLLCVAAYFLGSIPFGLVVGRALKGVDLRTVGSGNIGAANAFRTLGPVLGVITLLLDGLKGYGPVHLAGCFFAMFAMPHGPTPATAEVACGLAAIVGHNNSIYLGFKGGKGIATMFGVCLAISPAATLTAALAWGTAFGLTRYASLSSLCAAIAIPLYFMFTDAPRPHVLFGVMACVLAFVRHRSNIRNLLSGRELRLSAGEAAEGADEPSR